MNESALRATHDFAQIGEELQDGAKAVYIDGFARQYGLLFAEGSRFNGRRQVGSQKPAQNRPSKRRGALTQKQAYRALWRWAEKQGMKGDAFAFYLGVARSTIYKWAYQEPRPEHRIAILEKTGVLFPVRSRR